MQAMDGEEKVWTRVSNSGLEGFDPLLVVLFMGIKRIERGPLLSEVVFWSE